MRFYRISVIVLVSAIITAFRVLLMMIASCLYIYFFPTVVAFKREQPNPHGILLVNLAFGWLLIPWAFLLLWAYRTNYAQDDALAGVDGGSSAVIRTCPSCAEKMKVDALYCHHCGE